MNPKNNNSKKTSSKKSLSSSKKEIKVDPIFIKDFSRCGGCTNSLNNCVCYENISDDAIEQINEYEEENKRLKKELELLKKDNKESNQKDQEKKIKDLNDELRHYKMFFKASTDEQEEILKEMAIVLNVKYNKTWLGKGNMDYVDDFKEVIQALKNEKEELKEELELLKKDNKDQKKKINDLENELDEKKDNFNYSAYKDERDYEKDYFDLVNKYNVLETDYLLLKNKTADYDYILEDNNEMKKMNEKRKEEKEDLRFNLGFLLLKLEDRDRFDDFSNNYYLSKIKESIIKNFDYEIEIKKLEAKIEETDNNERKWVAHAINSDEEIKELKKVLDKKEDWINYLIEKRNELKKDLEKINEEQEEEIRELNKEIDENKETFKSWAKEIKELKEENIKIKDGLLSYSLKYKWQEVDIKKLEMKIEHLNKHFSK